MVSAGFKKIQSLEILVNLIRGWKEDLLRIEEIQKSGVLARLDECYTMTPAAHAFAVGTYVCMVAEILGRTITPENSAQCLQDVKQLGTFQSTVLKIPKTNVPKIVAAATDKFIKDTWFWALDFGV